MEIMYKSMGHLKPYIQTHSSSWSLLAGPELIQLNIDPFTSKEGQWLTVPKGLAILSCNDDIDSFIKITEQDKFPIYASNLAGYSVRHPNYPCLWL